MDALLSKLIQRPRSEEVLLIGLEAYIGSKNSLLSSIASSLLSGSLTGADISQLYSLSQKPRQFLSKYSSFFSILMQKLILELLLQDFLFLKRSADETLIQNYCQFIAFLMSLSWREESPQDELVESLSTCLKWCHFYLTKGGKFIGEIKPFRGWIASEQCTRVLLFLFIKVTTN